MSGAVRGGDERQLNRLRILEQLRHHDPVRAADLYQINGLRLDARRRAWDLAPPQLRPRNLGWRLYKALATYGRWAQPPGYPVQLFGPWTREEGPWKRISDRLLAAHRDHIHIAL